MADLAALLANPRLIDGLRSDEAAAAIAELAAIQAALAVRLRQAPPAGAPPSITQPDRLLEPAEAAARLGVTIRWLYRHAHELPFTRRMGRKVLRFSEAGLQRFLANPRP